jgi:preprotein translocase subunit SecE
MDIFSKIQKYFKEVLLEIKKVNWPTREETLRYTLIVIGISVGLAVYLGGLDFVFDKLLNMFVL